MSFFEQLANSISRFLYSLTGEEQFRPHRQGLPDWLETPVQRARLLNHDHQHTIQEIRGLFYLFLLLFIIFIVFPYLGGRLFEPQVVPSEVAAHMHATNPFYKRFPVWLLYRFDPRILRYALAPLLATLTTFVAAGWYVKDIYNLRSFNEGLRYVISSMFAVRYPILHVANGKEELRPGQTSLLNQVGGPGFVVIEPGSAVLFKKINESSDLPVQTGHFMEPFEQIALIADLEDQEGVIDNATSTTNDGIRVRLNDIHYRYRIIPPEVDGRPMQRSMDDPYPYSPKAIFALAYGSSVNDDGPNSWAAAVQRFIKSAISEQVNKNTVDSLTAPRGGRDMPRELMRNILNSEKVRASLASIGAQLIWIDVGHIDVVSGDVDQARLRYWASEMDGQIRKEQAMGEARRMAMRELGRAEAQAEMITAIGKALDDVDITANSKDNLRTLLLVRTSQILDAMRDNANRGEDDQ